jgi:L-lactate permease
MFLLERCIHDYMANGNMGCFSSRWFHPLLTAYFSGCNQTTRAIPAIHEVCFALRPGLAYLFNYSGMVYTLGLAISKVGAIYPFFAVFLGWIGVLLSGSDTSSNALFGNLQVVAAHQLNLSPVLMAASNSTGGVMAKMISPQNVTTGVSTSTLVGKEGLVVARVFKHGIFLVVLLGLLVMAESQERYLTRSWKQCNAS